MIALRVKETPAMVALDGSWPRNVGVIRSITLQIVMAVFASAFLASVMIVLFVTLLARFRGR